MNIKSKKKRKKRVSGTTADTASTFQSAVYFLDQAALLITAEAAAPVRWETDDWQQPRLLIAPGNPVTDSRPARLEPVHMYVWREALKVTL